MDFQPKTANLQGGDTRKTPNLANHAKHTKGKTPPHAKTSKPANHAKPSKSARRQDPPLPKIGFQTICPNSLSILSNTNTHSHLPLSLPFSCLYLSVVLFLFVQGFDFFSNLLICQHLFFHLWNPVSDLSP